MLCEMALGLENPNAILEFFLPPLCEAYWPGAHRKFTGLTKVQTN